MTVGTPSNAAGSIDLRPLEAAGEATGDAFADSEGRHLVVVKSTVTPMSIERVLEPAISRGTGATVELGRDSEVLRERSAVNDFLESDKLVGKTASAWATGQL